MIDDAVRIAEAAGSTLLERFGRLAAGEIERIGRRDVVTAADRASEALIARELARATPHVPILAEEATRGLARDGRPSGPMWIVDPLDGTVNFVLGIPMFAVSIGLVEDGRPALGVVHAPALGTTWVGAPGGGATENGRPIAVSVCPDVREAVFATGFPYDREHLLDDNIENFVAVGREARGMRRFGAAALDLAYVASGRLDGFWELHLSPWDVAAGAAIVRAAGGRVTDARGGEDWLFGGHVVATNALVHDRLRALLAPLRGL